MYSLEETIRLANAQLKKERVAIRIKRRGNTLFLVGTLPPKPGSKKQKPHQQEISLKISAEETNIANAMHEARTVAFELKCQKFNWEERSQKVYAQAHRVIKDYIKEYEESYWQTHARNRSSEENWQRMYMPYYKKLNQEVEPTIDEFIRVLEYYKPNSQSRSRACQKLCSLAELCDFSTRDIRKLKTLRGNYGIGSTKRRNILTDQQIVELRVQIPPGPLRWMFEALAVWGLRPHELYEIDMEKLAVERQGVISVYSQKTKKPRVVKAIYPEWFSRWELWKGMPPPTKRKRDKGATITYYFEKLALGIQPYDLRHSWAVRALYWPEIDEARAARHMGHSLKIHQQVYEYWIDEYRAREEELKDKVHIPNDPPEKEWLKVRIQTEPRLVNKDTAGYVKIPCPSCNSTHVIWNGWAITKGKNYGRKQKCQECGKTHVSKPNSLAQASTL